MSDQLSAYKIRERQKEIHSEMVKKVIGYIPSGETRLNEKLIKGCLKDCAGLQREFDSLQTAYNFLFVTPYNPE